MIGRIVVRGQQGCVSATHARPYDRVTVTARRTWLLLLALGVLSSQAGHLLAYQLRFGATAQQVQSTGAHAYFPSLAKTGLGLVAAAVLAALLVVGLARVLVGRTPVRDHSGPSCVSLVAALYTLQLACFAGQEVVEAAMAGAPADSAAHLLLWGTLGQLPVAAVAALAMRWLMLRFESAVSEIRIALADLSPVRGQVQFVLIPVWRLSNGALLSSVAGPSLVKRGPPSSVRFSSH